MVVRAAAPQSDLQALGGRLVSRFDEYPVHQTEQPLARVASEHPEWQDRFYFNVHDRNGEFAIITGLGAFPNRKMVQGYLWGAWGRALFLYPGASARE